ncbi:MULTISPECIES: amidohydrolase family protein [Bifidobacterium]|jgi:imidazolonepropionase-like amidohydrolase|uniref:Amidohydrolase family protein n=1 Tax=Bifidobacterium tibiigranuli TaxID=2172043 RepID=A0A5N6S291_9BIFI|nr:amidohydrolase family protein [Bifidobacterium tibiigranuli]KAE8127214.1 amidohydrolase family protein [Bifidobacterium tibiigranuli]KAE8127563.1 amidohydrolase family protein [Bifidobacterium tibiigranuli]MCH3974295.1 amidohydrolase family protein [Bifidobacterium tibiigranuli]MCH4188858.1 amidohydrolase family protein [Bifidobacterium tibiigranuli]MCH4203237.1 amidohydrolase family protein [Bifidobacterium tibiigranuli]
MAIRKRTTTVEPFALEHTNIVTGDEDGRTLTDMTIVIDEGGRISQVMPSAQIGVPQGYHRIDASEKFVAPGLINMHVHLFADGKPINPKQATPKGQALLSALTRTPVGRSYIRRKAVSGIDTLLNSGVTTIRTVGDVGYVAVGLRDKIAAGKMLGPRIFASGPMLASPGGHGAPLVALECEDEESARTNVEKNIDHGVNAIKIAATGGITDSQVLGEAGSPQMDVESMRTICDAAHACGLLVAAHAQSPEGVKNALTAGVDTIEHGSALDDELIALFHENPNSLHGYSSLIPTLSAGMSINAFPRDVSGITEIQYENSKPVSEGMLAAARQAHMNGIRVGVGTDTGMTFVTQYATWRELYLLAHYAGFTAAEALHAATQVNAQILDIGDETGSIEVGKAADLLVLDADPTQDLRTLTSPKLVVAAGRPVWRPKVKRFDDIDTMLDERL